MNFEEVLHTQDGATFRQDGLPFGVLGKRQIDHKYGYVLSVRSDLLNSQSFRKGLEADSKQNQHLRIKQQLHYELSQDTDGGEKVELILEPGSYQSFAQLLDVNPAIVAKSGFVDNVVVQLFEGLEQLHEQSVFHLCFAPQNLLIRKGDEMPMMLVHASSFGKLDLQENVFSNQRDYIAPEIFEGQSVTARSDIYSLGRFIEHLFAQGSMPYEYKRIVAKATRSNPEKRYASIAEMRTHLQRLRSLKRAFLTFVAAAAICLCCLGLYVELMPSGEDIEFIEAAPKEPMEDILLDGSFNPVDSIDIEVLADSGMVDTITVDAQGMMEVYMKKSEDIFRKQFTQEADRLLSKVYSKENLNSTESKFLASSSAMHTELLKLQNSLAEQAGISQEVAARISSEIVDRLTKEKINLASSQPVDSAEE